MPFPYQDRFQLGMSVSLFSEEFEAVYDRSEEARVFKRYRTGKTQSILFDPDSKYKFALCLSSRFKPNVTSPSNGPALARCLCCWCPPARALQLSPRSASLAWFGPRSATSGPDGRSWKSSTVRVTSPGRKALRPFLNLFRF